MNFSVFFFGFEFCFDSFCEWGLDDIFACEKRVSIVQQKDYLKIKWMSMVFVGMKLGSILHGVLGIIPGSA